MSKEKVLHNPIKPKYRRADIEFANPTKEQATTGRFMPAGDDYGTGFRVNVGREGQPKGYDQGPIPLKPYAFRPGEAID